jgi:filamentous hemagglutinin family protein
MGMNRLVVWAIAGTTAACFMGLDANAVRADGLVPATDGTGTQVIPNGNTFDITGGTTSSDNQNLFHSFEQFNLLTGESATFITNPDILNILSRVSGGNPSIINGLLQVSGSNANLFLLNPNGILLGPDSALNLQGSFTAVTADQVNFATGVFGTVGTPDYAALVGSPQGFSFSLENPASIVNAGTLSVGAGESLVLIGGQVLQTGTLSAPGGEVVISAVEGGRLVRIAQDGRLLNLEVETLTAAVPAGLTAVSPQALPELLTGSAIATATNVTVNPDGTVQLIGGETVSTAPGAATVSGRVDTSGSQGGQILVLGTDVAIADAQLNASGTTGSGQINIGGNFQGSGPLPNALTTTMAADSTLRADALDTGDGGTVILWAEGTTRFAGTISAQGGLNGGDGGLVETSGRAQLTVEPTAQVNTLAPNGDRGVWLLDPAELTVVNDGTGTASIDTDAGVNAPDTATTIEASTVVTGLEFTDVTLQADNLISINAAIDASDNLVPGNLTLDAPTVNLNDKITLSTLTFPFPTLDGTATTVNVQPVGEIADALDIVVNGGTVNLAAATFQEADTIRIFQDVTINGADRDRTILDGQNAFTVLSVFSPNTVNLNNVTIADGQGVEGGPGGIENLGGELLITNSRILNHEGSEAGGGIANTGGLTLADSVLSGNIITNDAGGGAAIFNAGRLEVINSTLEGNTALIQGGGLLNSPGAIANIRNSTIAGNSGSFGNGGGIVNEGTLTVSNSTINGNIAAQNGGGILNEGTLTVSNSTISRNIARAGDGGGILNEGALSVSNSTISGNSATGEGGGISNLGGVLDVTSTLLSGNEAATGPNLANSGSFGNGGNNLFGANGDAGVTGVSPGGSDLVPSVPVERILDFFAQDNGGLTNTIALPPGSPAIDAGSGTAADQRGVAVVNGIRDIGAFESRGFTIAIQTGDAQTTLINEPFATPLTVLVRSPFGEPVGGGEVVFDVATVEGASASLSLGRVPLSIASGAPVSQATASITAIANDTTGTYPVTATLDNTNDSVAFALTNTTTVVPPEPPEPPPANEPDCPEGDCTTLVQEPPEPPPRRTARDRSNDSPDYEAEFVTAFEDYLGVEAMAFQDIDALERAETITGVAPALVYARFVPNTEEPTVANRERGIETAAKERSSAETVIAQTERRQTPADIGDEAVLELVLVTPGNEPQRFRTNATRGQALAAVRQLHLELTDRTRRRLTNYLIPAQSLYGWLVAPLEEALTAANIGHVSFILDEGLRSLPLATLHDGEQFMIENYSVGLMPSLSLTDTRIGNIRNASVLAMGASEFTDQPPLPAVPLELGAINNLWSGEQYLNETFTPERVVQERSADPYPVLHLATHGQFNNDGLDNSYIQFWNRRLSLDELPQLQLSDPAVELLVLSACRTVLGGEEAELGFAGLAIQSGAKTAIAALWQVSDLETAGLMAELYTHLGQVSYKAEALRQAQLAMLRGEVTVQDGMLTWSGGQAALPPDLAASHFRDTRHPYYWSAFTLVGSPW